MISKLQEVISIGLEITSDSLQYKRLIEHLKGNVHEGIIFCGVGKNWYVAEKETKTFISMGLDAQSLDPVHALHGDLGMVKNQTMFFISKSGTTEELIKLVKVIRYLKDKKGIDPTLVAVFCNGTVSNDIKSLFDYVLCPNYEWTTELDSRNLIPTLSILLQQYVIDSIGVELYEAAPTLVKNYEWNHMSGKNGERLGMKEILKNI